MKQHLFILLLFTGVVPIVQAVSRKFYLILQGKTGTEAQAYCRAMYTDLATIEHQYEADQIQKLALSQNLAVSAWIGLYNDVNSWRWSMGNEPLGSYSKWFSPNPDNTFSTETCVTQNLLYWFDNTCAELFSFVCYDVRNTGASRFIYISTAMTWSQAQSYCRQEHTDLASIKNDNELYTIMGKNSGHSWIGLFRDTWKWSDQTNFTTIIWATGQPNNNLKNEDCVSLLNGQANDEKCSIIKPFFCYAVITGRKQIAKIHVQSNQDVNDPAFKAAILNQIKMMLGNHGNITAKWREQPNGLVFNKIQENTPTVFKILGCVCCSMV